MKSIIIPPELAHLKIDPRGYPVPFFVSKKNGVYDFVNLDINKQQIAVDQKLCGICGKKLYKDFMYFISGPLGMKNRASSDPAMHRVCAEFSLSVCPHLHFRAAPRRDHTGDPNVLNNPFMILEKPEFFYLIKASKYKYDIARHVIIYSFVSAEKYFYKGGILTKEIN